jgi:phage terminase large subunit GpA-like protein
MDLSEVRHFEESAIADHLARGLAALGVPAPVSLLGWAERHFYLSAESSYVEQRWTAWPFQRAIMACISHDDIEEIDWPKAARVGNTKIMLAAIGYFSEHKRRNQAIWQPTDDDRDGQHAAAEKIPRIDAAHARRQGGEELPPDLGRRGLHRRGRRLRQRHREGR